MINWIKKLFGPKRISNKDPLETEPCEWCKKVKKTTLNSIWSNADPVGRTVRLCNDCVMCCAN